MGFQICGLNRRGLVDERLKLLKDAVECLELLTKAMRKGNDIEEEYQTVRLCRLGDRGAPFTSMVRWFAENYLRDAWTSFERLPA